jgi:hypothetical protein
MTVCGIFTINIKLLFICLIILGELSHVSTEKSGSNTKTTTKKTTTKKKQIEVFTPPPVVVEEQTCYNKSTGAAIRCLPEFVNAAFRRQVKDGKLIQQIMVLNIVFKQVHHKVQFLEIIIHRVMNKKIV